MPTNSKVGVSDIAKHAGVSIGTVSNYLNYPERVSETLKAKIGAAIQELGYVPRRAAPSPAQTTTGTPIIGYVMTDIEHSLSPSFLKARRRCARKTVCRLSVSTPLQTSNGSMN